MNTEAQVGHQRSEPTPAELTDLFTRMTRIRAFENRVRKALFGNKIKTPCHLYLGQEAVAAGVCCHLNDRDVLFTNHRSHGHYLAKGGDVNRLMAEIFTKETGCSHGRGGSMHVTDPSKGILGSAAIIGAGLPMAVGAALGLKGTGQTAVVFIGDGATEEGIFHESLMFASYHRLPVLFVVENNNISCHLSIKDRQHSNVLSRFAVPHGVPTKRVNGNDPLAVWKAARDSIGLMRKVPFPILLEVTCNRWVGHVGPRLDHHIADRSKIKIQQWMNDDPLKKLHPKLPTTVVEKITEEIENEVEKAYEFAIRSPHPTDHTRYIFA